VKAGTGFIESTLEGLRRAKGKRGLILHERGLLWVNLGGNAEVNLSSLCGMEGFLIYKTLIIVKPLKRNSK
jgi:hypothetical protein